MGCVTGARSGLKYATTFDEKLFGKGCDVDVIVDLESGEASATVAMRPFLRSNPPFRISSEDLAALAQAVKLVGPRSSLLDALAEGALDHQLSYSTGGATLIVVHPKGRSARYTLSIGMFQKEGELGEPIGAEIEAAVKRTEELKAKVLAKVT